MSESFFANYFSSNELDSSLSVSKHQSHYVFNDLKDIEPKSVKDEFDIQEHHLKLPQVTPTKRTKIKAKRPKRGDSLEREIAKLVLSEAHGVRGIDLQILTARAISPAEILSDLIASQNEINPTGPSRQTKVTKPNDTSECKNSEVAYFDDSTAAGHFAEDHLDIVSPRELFSKTSTDSDAFNFSTTSNEWAVFDDTSIFGIEHKSKKELDDDGFPVTFGEKSREERRSSVNLDIESSQESMSIQVPVKEDKSVKDDDEKLEEAKATAVPHPESTLVRSCDDKSVQSESKTGLLSLPESFKSNSYDFEPKKSPSSVANFPTKEGSTSGQKTGGLYVFKRQNTGLSKSSWSPKPPEHYKTSNIVLFRPGDTLV